MRLEELKISGAYPDTGFIQFIMYLKEIAPQLSKVWIQIQKDERLSLSRLDLIKQDEVIRTNQARQ